MSASERNSLEESPVSFNTQWQARAVFLKPYLLRVPLESGLTRERSNDRNLTPRR